jgi:hypothetical protein
MNNRSRSIRNLLGLMTFSNNKIRGGMSTGTSKLRSQGTGSIRDSRVMTISTLTGTLNRQKTFLKNFLKSLNRVKEPQISMKATKISKNGPKLSKSANKQKPTKNRPTRTPLKRPITRGFTSTSNSKASTLQQMMSTGLMSIINFGSS